MIEVAKRPIKTVNQKAEFFGASDRMMIFIPAKTRGRKGIVIVNGSGNWDTH